MASSAPTASEWLSRAAERLGCLDAPALVGDAVARALPERLGEAAHSALLPGAVPFELSFSEAAPEALRFDFEPLGWERLRESVTAWVAGLAEGRWGAAVATELAARAGRAAERAGAGFGAFAGAVFDRSGLREVKAYYPSVDADGELVGVARAVLPRLEPLMHSIAVADGAVVERAYLVSRAQLDLPELEPLLATLGLAHRAPAMLVTLAQLIRAPALAPGSAIVGLRDGPAGPELKVEVPAATLPGDTLATAGALLAERPDSHAAFRRWCAALALPAMRCRASVVSVCATPAAGVRLSIYVHPVPDDHGDESATDGAARAARVG